MTFSIELAIHFLSVIVRTDMNVIQCASGWADLHIAARLGHYSYGLLLRVIFKFGYLHGYINIFVIIGMYIGLYMTYMLCPLWV